MGEGSDHFLATLLGSAEHCGRPSRRGSNGQARAACSRPSRQLTRTAHEVARSPFLRARARGARTGVVELEGVYAGTDRTERGKRAMTCLARASAWKSRAQIETTTDRAGVR